MRDGIQYGGMEFFMLARGFGFPYVFNSAGALNRNCD